MKWLLFGLVAVVIVAIALWGLGRWCWSSKTRALLDKLEASRSSAAVERFNP
ncbi:hypothetical protein [Thauera sp.]|uniref:hypothetical protein n=1 Tax=Thauera sp. TaxID=1905334 RepID=UPI002C25FCF7|nr:hypothetical protein [Thauera sp.]HRP25541.1 hypothetical protein [Thauera sp.]